MKLRVEPGLALVDESICIRVEGLQPDEEVRLHAELEDDTRCRWSSSTLFLANARGELDTSATCAVGGSYAGVHTMGWLWSMLPVGARSGLFVKSGVAPTRVDFRVEARGGTACGSGWLRFIGGGVERRLLKEHGLVGELYLPEQPGPHPIAIVLPGWPTGGLAVQSAALLASRGIAALALGYFAAPGLPSRLAEISLDYFEHALDWIEQQGELDPERIAVIGYSRGAELSLIVASSFSRIRAAVAFLPSSVPLQAMRWRPLSRSAAWMSGGAPIPFVSFAPASSRTAAQLWRVAGGAPLRVRPLIEESLRRAHDLDRVTIPVERVAGPVLLFSAGDDAIWPSQESCERLMQRLDAHGHAYPREHVHYPEAGHELWFSRVALPSTRMFRKLGASVDLGGNARADAMASSDSWSRVQTFLKERLA